MAFVLLLPAIMNVPVNHISLPDGFKGEFISFLQSHNVSSQMRGEREFVFHEHKLRIRLVLLNDFECCKRNTPRIFSIEADDGSYDTLYLYEDRWRFQREFVQKRILARLGRFKSIFARKCRVITNEHIKHNTSLREQIDDFLEHNHMYGKAKCKYRYALEYEGQIVAVATFSESRPMPRDVIVFDSYEWVRYASLPDCRVVGGMGRLLKAFLNDVHAIGVADLAKVAEFPACTAERPVGEMKGIASSKKRPVEVMSYSDTEWSQGAVYESLGFKLHQEREPVWFYVNKKTGERISVNKVSRQGILSGPQLENDFVKICNCGSRKYLLQLL